MIENGSMFRAKKKKKKKKKHEGLVPGRNDLVLDAML